MKLLEKALYTIGGLLAGSFLAFNVACSAPPTPTIQIQRPTFQPTVTPLHTPTSYRGISFDALLIKEQNCDRIIFLSEFSRQSSSQREGWDAVSGRLIYQGLPECGTVGIDRNPYHPEIVYGIGPLPFYYARKDNEGGEIDYYLIVVNTWEGGGKSIIKLPGGNASAPYSSIEIPFSFEVPHITQQLKFDYEIWGRSYGTRIDSPIGAINEFADNPAGVKNGLASFLNSLVQGSLSTQPVAPSQYSEWFNTQLLPYTIENLFDQKNLDRIAKDTKVELNEFKTSDRKIFIKVEVSNTSYTQDLSFDGEFLPSYYLTEDGRFISRYSGRAFIFSSDRTVIPPGYTTKGSLEFTIPGDAPKNARYLAGQLSLIKGLHPDSHPAIIDLKELR